MIKLSKCQKYNKVKFLNRKLAEAHADDNQYTQRAYYCKACDHFHLTSKQSFSNKEITDIRSVRKQRKKPRRLL